jgi:hypothetical protein
MLIQIGKQWLKRRMGNEDFGIDIGDGTLAQVEGAISAGADLNAYCKHAPNDAYTLLQLACWNEHAGDVSSLISSPFSFLLLLFRFCAASPHSRHH